MSGIDEEIKNVDKNINSARDTLFGFLGNLFAYKCKLSPAVQCHVWQTFVKPVLRSGLAALPIRPPVIKTLTTFHHKVIRAILKLSSHSPVAPLYFLLGEIPLDASVHLDVLALFWNIWSNPQTKIFGVLKYLLSMCEETSLTWSGHVRILFHLYNLPDPMNLLDTHPWPKERWKQHCKAHEAIFGHRVTHKTKYLNMQATGLSGRIYPILAWVMTTQDVEKVRPHVKMLAGDYQCYANLASDQDIEPHCRMCELLSSQPSPVEDLEHILTRCRATADTRNRIIPELLNTLAGYYPGNGFLTNITHATLTQFILDC